MQKQEGSRKHLTLRQRIYIEVGILKGTSVSKMEEYLRFSRQTIYREILGNSFLKNKRNFNRVNSEISCQRLLKYPFVCNDCELKQKCYRLKRYYHAEEAHESASSRLVKSRSRTRLSKGEILTLEESIGPGLRKGQSLHHIIAADKEAFTIKERTIRNLINRGELIFHNIDLPMTVRFKAPTNKSVYIKRSHMPEVLLGRTYADFKDFARFGDHYAQIDSVIGKRSDKQTIITIIFPTLSFIFGFISPQKGWLSVNNGLIKIQEKLGFNLFKKSVSRYYKGNNRITIYLSYTKMIHVITELNSISFMRLMLMTLENVFAKPFLQMFIVQMTRQNAKETTNLFVM